SIVVSIVAGVLGIVIGDAASLLSWLYSLAVFIPGIAVTTRRLHDTGRSGWWQLLWFALLIGWIVLLIFFTQDSSFERNQYGPNPKSPSTTV
ncbi:MAG: DUF805 domain-containing protein, partial [Cyanobacteria bacterium P01_C01_bin.121]